MEAATALTARGRGPDPDDVAHQRAWDAVQRIREHGRKLIEAFDDLETAKHTLHEHGVRFEPSFARPITAAYSIHRREPIWDRIIPD